MDREGLNVSGSEGASHSQGDISSEYLPCPPIVLHCQSFYVLCVGENGMGSTCGEESLSLMLHMAYLEAMGSE